jgi:tetratricopeptide (TPR) repeat protein
MNMDPQPSHTTPARRFAWIAVCLLIGLAAALALKHRPASENTPAPAPAVAAAPPKLSTEQILASFPPNPGQSDTDKALNLALEKVRSTPADARLWARLGDALAQKMRDTNDESYFGHAEKAYQQALEIDPKNLEAITGIAWVKGGRHLFPESIEWANRALAIDPENAPAHGIAGDAAVEVGDYEAAFDSYQKMMDSKPDLSSWSRGAYLLWLTGDTRKAAWLMQKAIAAGGPFAENTAWCRAKYATMLFHEGAYPAAVQAIQPALQAAPTNTQVLLAAGKITAATKDYAAAAKHFQAVVDHAPHHDALVGLGDLALIEQDSAAAEKFHAQVEELSKKHLAVGNHSHIYLAKFYADHDRNLVEALRIAEQSKLTKNVHEADILAWVYFKTGDLPKAIEAIKRALSQGTPDAEIHYHAGMIAAQFGDRQSAQRHLKRALSLNPQFSLLQSPLAAAALEKLGPQTANSDVPPPPADQPAEAPSEAPAEEP